MWAASSKSIGRPASPFHDEPTTRRLRCTGMTGTAAELGSLLPSGGTTEWVLDGVRELVGFGLVRDEADTSLAPRGFETMVASAYRSA